VLLCIPRLGAALQGASGAWKPGDDGAGLVTAAQDRLAERQVKGRFLTELEWRRLLDFLHDEDKWLQEGAKT